MTSVLISDLFHDIRLFPPIVTTNNPLTIQKKEEKRLSDLPIILEGGGLKWPYICSYTYMCYVCVKKDGGQTVDRRQL